MRLNTGVVIGIRNVGDARDQGEFFSGTLRDALGWILDKVQSKSMAKRMQIVIARNEDECRVGLDLGKSTLTAQMGKYSSLFAAALGDDDDEPESEVAEQLVTAERSGSDRLPDPRDDWKD